MTGRVIFFNQSWNKRPRFIPVVRLLFGVLFPGKFQDVFEMSLRTWSALPAILAGSSSKHPTAIRGTEKNPLPATVGGLLIEMDPNPLLQGMLFPVFSSPRVFFQTKSRCWLLSSAKKKNVEKGRVTHPVWMSHLGWAWQCWA